MLIATHVCTCAFACGAPALGVLVQPTPAPPAPHIVSHPRALSREHARGFKLAPRGGHVFRSIELENRTAQVRGARQRRADESSPHVQQIRLGSARVLLAAQRATDFLGDALERLVNAGRARREVHDAVAERDQGAMERKRGQWPMHFGRTATSCMHDI